MIIVCENCDTRFRLDEKRLPPEGARVRCSRCQHRFHVEPPSAAAPASAASESSAVDQAPAAERGPEDSATAPRPAPTGGEEEPDLENPEFIYNSSLKESAEAEEPEPDEPAPFVSAAAPAKGFASPIRQAASQEPPDADEEWVDHGFSEMGTAAAAESDEPEEPDEPVEAEEPPAEREERWADEESGLGALDPAGLDLAGGGEEAGSPGAQEYDEDAEDEPVLLGSSSGAVAPASPAVAAGPQPSDCWDASDLSGGTAGEEADPFAGLIEDLAEGRPSEPATGSTASSVPLAAPSSKAQPGPAPSAPLTTRGPGRVPLWPAALALAALLAVGGFRAATSLASGDFALREVPGAAGWRASDLEAFHLRDANGRPVLVVRGVLHPSGKTPPPEVRLELRDGSGESIAAPAYRTLARLRGADLAPLRLARRLSRGLDERQTRPSGAIGGFTLLVPDPPEEARTYRVRLEER
jgi:predicted Zn finger-like uncharacterized protein